MQITAAIRADGVVDAVVGATPTTASGFIFSTHHRIGLC